MQNIKNIVRSLVITALLVSIVVNAAAAEASAQEAIQGEEDELIMWPTNLKGCDIVDLDSDAEANGGELSDEQMMLRDELMNDYSYFSLSGDGMEALYSERCQNYPEFVNSLPDEARWDFYSKFELPPAGEGTAWAEDLTLVPSTYWS